MMALRHVFLIFGIRVPHHDFILAAMMTHPGSIYSPLRDKQLLLLLKDARRLAEQVV